MAVRIYQWDDAGAPELTGTAGSFIAVLDACLVNGYGSKPAAGWSKPFSGTNSAAYRASGGTQAYLYVIDKSTTAAQLLGFMAMSGLGVGDDPFPTSAQSSTGSYFYKSAAGTTPRPWVLVADSKRFYLFGASAQTAAEGMQASSNLNSNHAVFFGDIVSYVPFDAYHAALMSSSSSVGTSGHFGTIDLGGDIASNGHHIARDCTQTGSALAVCKTASGRASTGTIGAAGGPYPSPSHGGMDLEPVFVNEPATRTTRGHMPGLWNPIHTRPGTPMDTFTGKSGTPMAGKTFIILPVVNSSVTGKGHCCLEISDTWE